LYKGVVLGQQLPPHGLEVYTTLMRLWQPVLVAKGEAAPALEASQPCSPAKVLVKVHFLNTKIRQPSSERITIHFHKS
jgi:hypothetical protein